MSYLYACCYEIGLWIIEQFPDSSVVDNPWFKRMMEYCLSYWSEVRTIGTMEDVDDQIQELHREWEEQELIENKPVFIEKESEVDGLPEMRLSAPWYHREHPE